MRGRTTGARYTVSIKSACRSGRRLSPPIFAKALDDHPVAVIPFEPRVFGAAANNGQMIAETSSNHRTAEMFRQLAQQLTGRAELKKQRSGLLPPLINKLLQRQA